MRGTGRTVRQPERRTLPHAPRLRALRGPPRSVLEYLRDCEKSQAAGRNQKAASSLCPATVSMHPSPSPAQRNESFARHYRQVRGEILARSSEAICGQKKSPSRSEACPSSVSFHALSSHVRRYKILAIHPCRPPKPPFGRVLSPRDAHSFLLQRNEAPARHRSLAPAPALSGLLGPRDAVSYAAERDACETPLRPNRASLRPSSQFRRCYRLFGETSRSRDIAG